MGLFAGVYPFVSAPSSMCSLVTDIECFLPLIQRLSWIAKFSLRLFANALKPQ